MPDVDTPDIRDDIIIQATLNAADILSGMGYTGKHGSIHLLQLNLQTNTVTAILHNIIAWQISRLDPRWTFKPKGGPTPDLVQPSGKGIQIKTTSNRHIKGNRISQNEGYYIIVKYDRKDKYEIVIREILAGELHSSDWDRREGTQWAILKQEAALRLRRLFP